jgi:NAD(P)-dependent dehydrogenase (short-subunit alcohol dehydrogenase family)
MQIADRVFLVTGGASGLGAAVAQRLVAAGGRVVIADINGPAAEVQANSFGDRAAAVTTDVASADQVTTAVQEGRRLWGRFDGVVHCAGILGAARVVGRNGPHDAALFARIVQVNLIGSFHVLRSAAAELAAHASPTADEERGVIVLTSSIAAEEGQIGQVAYAAAKGGVSAMILPAARELATAGIRVVAIAPGVFDTQLLAGVSQTLSDALASAIPFPPRFGHPEEFAQLAQQVIENSYLNGCVLRLDGGLRMPK